MTGCETSCTAWIYGRSTRSLEPQSQEIHPNGFPALWMSARSRLWIRTGTPISPTSRTRRDSSTWWRSWICSPETCSAGCYPTALTRSSDWMPWRWHWEAAVDQRSSTPTRVVSSPLVTSWPGYRERGSRSAGLGGSAAMTTSSLKDYGECSNTRRCTCLPTAMAGRLKSAWPNSCGGTAM